MLPDTTRPPCPSQWLWSLLVSTILGFLSAGCTGNICSLAFGARTSMRLRPGYSLPPWSSFAEDF